MHLAGVWGPTRPPEALGLLMQSPLMLASPEVIYHFKHAAKMNRGIN